MTEADAAKLVHDIMEADAGVISGRERRLRHPRSQSGFVSVPCSTYTEDTLILLSLVSEEMNIKVAQYRAEQRFLAPETAEERQRWQERRQELESIVKRTTL
ncbi:MAG: hypothetical protein ACR2KM_02260 [Gemmatimonadaceae bacterium]